MVGLAEKHKTKLVALLVLLALGTVGAGLFLQHYFSVALFGVWLFLEWAFWRFHFSSGARASVRMPTTGSVAEIIGLLERGDDRALAELTERLSELRADPYLPESEKRYVVAVRDLLELKRLQTPRGGRGKRALREAFFYHREIRSAEVVLEKYSFFDVDLQDITESAMSVADLYGRLESLKHGRLPELQAIAVAIHDEIVGKEFSSDRIADSMRRDGGVSFLVLNLIRNGHVSAARQIGQFLLGLEGEMDEEVRSSLYWISELFWFTREKTEPISDHENTIRYLYHLCFTNPDRAGFLEVDSQFFSEFATINELAQEAFLFKETLVEKVMLSWEEHEGLFDMVFQSVLESMTGQKSKIYDER